MFPIFFLQKPERHVTLVLCRINDVEPITKRLEILCNSTLPGRTNYDRRMNCWQNYIIIGMSGVCLDHRTLTRASLFYLVQ